MGCATGLVRYFFFAFNLIFWLLGIVVLGIGIYSRVQNDSWDELINTDTIFVAANLLIAAGIIVTIIGFLGCCGAIKKYQFMLMMYAILVIFIFILEIAAGAYAYSKRQKVEDELTEGIQKGIRMNYDKTDPASKGLSKAIDWFQKNVKCCGAAGPNDWQQSFWYTNVTKGGNTTAAVPLSCCKSQTSKCDRTANSTQIFREGCIEEGKIFAKGHLWLLGGVGVGIAAVEVLGVIFALCLRKAFQDEEKGVAA